MSTNQSRSSVPPLAPIDKRQDVASTFIYGGEAWNNEYQLLGRKLLKLLAKCSEALGT